MAMVEVIKDYGRDGSLSQFPKMIQKELDSNSSVSDPSNPTTAEMNDAKKAVQVVRSLPVPVPPSTAVEFSRPGRAVRRGAAGAGPRAPGGRQRR